MYRTVYYHWLGVGRESSILKKSRCVGLRFSAEIQHKLTLYRHIQTAEQCTIYSDVVIGTLAVDGGLYQM